MCTKIRNHTMYGFWDTEWDWQNFLSLWTIFALLPPKQPAKSKFWKHEKSTGRCYHFTYVYQKWYSYHVWFQRYGAWQTEFLIILDHILLFTPTLPPSNPENQNFEGMKKTSGDIILHMCTINNDHMYSSWDMECNRVFCHFGSFFALLLP